MKQQIYSKKLNKTVELDVIAVNDRAMLISSASLERLMQEECVKEYGFQVVVLWDNTKVSADHKSIIYEGYAQDREGVYPPTNGEANPANCDTEIARMYPARMALKRLKDACITSWLALETENGKVVYTNNETSTLEDSVLLTASTEELAQLVNEAAESPTEEELLALINGEEEDSQETSVVSAKKEATPDEEKIKELCAVTFKVKGEEYSVGELFVEKSLGAWLLRTEFRPNTSLSNAKNAYIEARKLKGEDD